MSAFSRGLGDEALTRPRRRDRSAGSRTHVDADLCNRENGQLHRQWAKISRSIRWALPRCNNGKNRLIDGQLPPAVRVRQATIFHVSDNRDQKEE